MDFFSKDCKDQIYIGKRVAFFTFLIGSIILLLYHITHYHGTIYFSLLFMVSAFFVNTFFAIQLLISYSNNKDYRKPILTALFLLFLNIPIGYLYIDLGFKIYNLISFSIV
ncbi:hypothetical protein [Flavobacterium luteum]|uniref:Uncharacterized protein n=1 Tax=Flavobacterium luteum TaxID=2026654 RepID=A0A7J5AHN9_9FLAO|nr:hypothetical protein [Flavobacterium luteum]KAB1157076.1 hypothetical protein F6464_06950 [Flavobacterium luteum]